jgi:hypothetical protein
MLLLSGFSFGVALKRKLKQKSWLKASPRIRGNESCGRPLMA